MTQQTITASATTSCDRTASVTRSLLAYGIIAGPIYVAVSVTQGLTRAGFDFTRHAWSLLANGDLGWIQIANFLTTGLMLIALAVGLRRALRPGSGATWAPRLIAGYGLGMIAAGIFRADPALGFPAGTPADAATVSWHGALHFVAAGVGFSCLIAACLVIGRRMATEGRREWAAFSRVTAVVFLAGFAAVASGGGAAWSNLAFVGAMLLSWAWISTVSTHLYRRVAVSTAGGTTLH